jgi:hypothetical protein
LAAATPAALHPALSRVVSSTSGAAAPTAPTAAAAAVAAAPAKAMKEFSIYRWNPDEGGDPIFQKYHVDINK